MLLAAAFSSALLLGGLAAGQEVQSKPFRLVVESANKTLNGGLLSACHTGAAIESLCFAGSTGSQFYLNTTEGSQPPLAGYEPSGVIVWNLPLGGGNGPSFVSEPLGFYNDPSTNVAIPLFMPGYTMQYVSFDKNGRLAIISYLDDTKNPPATGEPYALKNWYVCRTNYTGYRYQTLAWVFGTSSAKPQNPSCVKVQVRRQYV